MKDPIKEEYKHYKKVYKNLHKQLVKSAKNFRDYDYGFMLDTLELMLRLMHNLHSCRDLVPYSTKNEEVDGVYWDGEDRWNRIVSSLKQSIDLLEESKYEERWVVGRTSDVVLKAMFNVIGENITTWWD